MTTYREGRRRQIICFATDSSQLAQTTFLYNTKGLLIAFIDARNGTTSYEYDDNGCRVAVHSTTPVAGGKRQSTRFTYDDHDRLTAALYPDGSTLHRAYYLTGKLKHQWGSPRTCLDL